MRLGTMTSWRTTLALAAMTALLATAALAAACSDDDSAKNAKSNASTSDDPLAAIFGDPKTFGAQELKVQEKVRDCMVAQGFKYTPIDPTASSNVQTIDLGSDDFVKQNGFGISTFVDGFAFAGGAQQITRIQDPNSAYLETLNTADRMAYQKALFGDVPTQQDGAGGGQTIRIDGDTVGGCLGKANKEVRGDQPLNDPGLQDKLKQLSDRIDADPRLLAAGKNWSACMAKSGYNYTNEDGARAYIQRRTKDVTGKDPGTGVGGGGARGGGIAVTSEVHAPGSSPQATPTPSYDVVALHQLQDEERKLASASLDCRKKTMEAVEKKVRKEYEEAFLRDNPQLVNGSK